jgi:hypothetical protein
MPGWACRPEPRISRKLAPEGPVSISAWDAHVLTYGASRRKGAGCVFLTLGAGGLGSYYGGMLPKGGATSPFSCLLRVRVPHFPP